MIFRQITAFLLLLSFLFSQLGLAFSQHYCQGEYVKSALHFSNQTVGCVGINQGLASCPNTTDGVSKTPCCQNQTSNLSISNEFKNQSVNALQLDDFESITSFCFYVSKLESESKQTCFKPLFLFDQDLVVWKQEFLI